MPTCSARLGLRMAGPWKRRLRSVRAARHHLYTMHMLYFARFGCCTRRAPLVHYHGSYRIHGWSRYFVGCWVQRSRTAHALRMPARCRAARPPILVIPLPCLPVPPIYLFTFVVPHTVGFDYTTLLRSLLGCTFYVYICWLVGLRLHTRFVAFLHCARLHRTFLLRFGLRAWFPTHTHTLYLLHTFSYTVWLVWLLFICLCCLCLRTAAPFAVHRLPALRACALVYFPRGSPPIRARYAGCCAPQRRQRWYRAVRTAHARTRTLDLPFCVAHTTRFTAFRVPATHARAQLLVRIFCQRSSARVPHARAYRCTRRSVARTLLPRTCCATHVYTHFAAHTYTHHAFRTSFPFTPLLFARISRCTCATCYTADRFTVCSLYTPHTHLPLVWILHTVTFLGSLLA